MYVEDLILIPHKTYVSDKKLSDNPKFSIIHLQWQIISTKLLTTISRKNSSRDSLPPLNQFSSLLTPNIVVPNPQKRNSSAHISFTGDSDDEAENILNQRKKQNTMEKLLKCFESLYNLIKTYWKLTKRRGKHNAKTVIQNWIFELIRWSICFISRSKT